MKRLYAVRLENCPLFTVHATSSQNACRQAFRHWIAAGFLQRQPRTTDSGGFEGVKVYVR